MAKYRNKPVVIEARQFTEKTRTDVVSWSGARNTAIDDDGCQYETQNISIKTLEGEMMARPGDWIIRGVAGEFYPCQPDIFEATYEPVEAAND